MSNIVTKEQAQRLRMSMDKMLPEFAKALPKHVSPEKFARVTMTALLANPSIANGDVKTLLAAASRAAQMGLMPDGREGAIAPFGGKVTFMPMVAGIMKLVRNSGEISTWSVQVVREKDEFDFELGDEPRIRHRPCLTGEPGEVIGAYSIVTMKDGEKSREFMSRAEIEAIRRRSRSGESGPWKTDYEEMAKKTVIRRHSKRLPMSTDLDGILREDDELFMPAEQAQPQATPPEQAGETTVDEAPPPRRGRPSRLDRVAQRGQQQQPITDVEPNEEPDYGNEPPPQYEEGQDTVGGSEAYDEQPEGDGPI